MPQRRVFHIRNWDEGKKMLFISLDLWTFPHRGRHWHTADACGTIVCYGYVALIILYFMTFLVLVLHLESEHTVDLKDVIAVVHWFIAWCLQTNSSWFQIDNTCRPVCTQCLCGPMKRLLLSGADLLLTGSQRTLFVLCKWWLMTRLAQPAVFDKKYWWLLSVKC